MVKIRFLGACQEVGRSGVLIESEETGDAVLCDYGTAFSDKAIRYPEHVAGRDLTAVVLTHAHVDHSGAVPLFYISGTVPLYTTRLTHVISKVLHSDTLKISENFIPYGWAEVKKMERYCHFVKYGQRNKAAKNCWITLYNAGHIPGSAVALIEMDGKKILYTGDINTIDTQLLSKFDSSKIPPIDAVISEATYGNTEHSLDREKLEEMLYSTVNKTLKRGGTVLIPAFGVSRSQEIMMVLNRFGFVDYPIYIDGMAVKIAQIFSKYANILRYPKLYRDALRNSRLINGRNRQQMRYDALKKRRVIIAPSGMLRGGTAKFYIENLLGNKKNSIILVSYQVEGTPGRMLMENVLYYDEELNKDIEVEAEVHHFDFSSHACKSQLIEMLENFKYLGEKNVFLVHSDEENILKFGDTIKERGFNVEIPTTGQEFKI